jgi:hypothetical protein
MSVTRIYGNEYETHRPVLASAIEHLKLNRSELFVIEIGIGLGSTGYIRSLLREKDSLLSIENNNTWLSKMVGIVPPSEHHQYIDSSHSWYHTLKAVSKYIHNINKRVDLLFIDSSPWDSRTIAIDLLGAKSDLIVVHDVDYFPHSNIWGKEVAQITSREKPGIRDYSSVFPVWIEVFPTEFFGPTGPPTLLASFSDQSILQLTFSDSFVNSTSALSSDELG